MSWDVADLEDALDQLRKAGVRDVPRQGAAVLRLLPGWEAALGDLSPEELKGACGLWCAGADKRFPMPAQLQQVLAADRKAQRRQAEAAHGGQVPEAVRAAKGEHVGYVDRVFGREWTQGGRRWREYMTAADRPGHDETIPARWLKAGYTVELQVPPNRSPDAVGLEWRGQYAPDHSGFGAPRLKARLLAERANCDG